jgi:hypothetical protein
LFQGLFVKLPLTKPQVGYTILIDNRKTLRRASNEHDGNIAAIWPLLDVAYNRNTIRGDPFIYGKFAVGTIWHERNR